MAGKLKVTLVRSISGRPPVHRRTVAALGFKKLNQTRVVPDNPSMRGMIASICHMLKWEEVKD